MWGEFLRKVRGSLEEEEREKFALKREEVADLRRRGEREALRESRDDESKHRHGGRGRRER